MTWNLIKLFDHVKNDKIFNLDLSVCSCVCVCLYLYPCVLCVQGTVRAQCGSEAKQQIVIPVGPSNRLIHPAMVDSN